MSRLLRFLLVLLLAGFPVKAVWALAFNPVPYTVVTARQSLPAQVRQEAEKLKTTRGYWLYHSSRETLVVINLGQKPSAGYGLEVAGVEGKEGVITVRVREKVPPPDAVTAAVLTYPQLIIRVKPLAGWRWRIVSESGVEFKLLQEIKAPPVYYTVQGQYLGRQGAMAFKARVQGKGLVFRYQGKLNFRKGSRISIKYYWNARKERQAVEVRCR
ncbi:MAG: protease complex subunit PrcB family protein [Bacillota bacterium]